MKRILQISFMMVSCILTSFTYAQETILNFNSDITVKKNASLDVIESITVNAENQQIKHGIYRDFPTIYKDSYGFRYRVNFHLKSVLRDAKGSQYHVENMDNGIRIYIGSKNSYVPLGQHTYQISYNVTRELGFFENFDELYWNVTGNGWVFPIEKASALVRLPAAVGKNKLSIGAYTGYQGATGKDYKSTIVSPTEIKFVSTRPLNSYEGLTIVVGWPKGLVDAPTLLDKAKYFLTDNIGVSGALVLFIYFFVVWCRVGRDPKKGTIIPLYESPSGCSPALMRYVIKTRADYKGFAAGLTSLAVKTAVIMKEENETITICINNKNIDVSFDERVLLDLIAEEKNEITIRGGDLIISSLLKAHEKSLVAMDEEYLFRNKDLTFLGALFGCVMSFFIFLFESNYASYSQSSILIATTLLLTMLFLYLNKQPTYGGRKILDEAEGMREYLNIGEQDFLKKIQEGVMTPELFEKLLPYAIALDLEGEWSKKFDVAVEQGQETWNSYRASWYAGNLSGHSFAQSAAGLGGVISSAATPPGSSSGGGGGGGGSSGGGGGGGGGGGW